MLENKLTPPPQENSPQQSRRENRLRVERVLPEHYRNMTFPGRYNAQMAEIFSMIHLESLPDRAEVNFLDMAGGMLPTGSPTAHDALDGMSDLGAHAHITVVDRQYDPQSVAPLYPEIDYLTELDNLPSERKFHIIRMMHLVEHVSLDEYTKIRQDLVSRLEEGGLFIVTQNIGYEIPSGRQDTLVRTFRQVVKVMQKRGEDLIPIALMPDTLMPLHDELREMSNQQREVVYEKYRLSVMQGMTEYPKPELDQKNMEYVRNYLRSVDPRILQSELLSQTKRFFLMASNEKTPFLLEPWQKEETETLQNLEQAAHTAADWFKKGFSQEQK
jgi:hypothetical protein